MNELLARPCWIFDMDGTLTVPIHDFDAIRAELGLPEGQPILETLAELDPDHADVLHQRLAVLERDLAMKARPEPDALALVEALRVRHDRKLGIVTRNSSELAALTLTIIALDDSFAPDDRIGRDQAAPKPSPDGILQLLQRWGAAPEDAVMVGDYLFDLQAGRAAGTATVLVDRGRHGRWADHADLVVSDLRELLR